MCRMDNDGWYLLVYSIKIDFVIIRSIQYGTGSASGFLGFY